MNICSVTFSFSRFKVRCPRAPLHSIYYCLSGTDGNEFTGFQEDRFGGSFLQILFHYYQRYAASLQPTFVTIDVRESLTHS